MLAKGYFFHYSLLYIAHFITSITSQEYRKAPVQQVLVGGTVTLLCGSNDNNHSFHYWHLPDTDVLIGPFHSNRYDYGKYQYEVLSGNLTIKSVSKREEGYYSCVSRGVRNNDINIRTIRIMVVRDWEDVYEHDPGVNAFRTVIIILTLFVIGGFIYAGYRIWKTRHRYPNYLVPTDDEDENDEEVFRAPGTSDDATINIERKNFDSPGISTDFESILDTANNK